MRALGPKLLVGLAGLSLVVAPGSGYPGPPPDVAANRPPPRVEPPPLEPTAHTLEAGVYGGVFAPSRDHEIYDSSQSFQSPYDAFGGRAGLRLGYFPLRFLGVEAEGGYTPIGNLQGDEAHLFDVRGHAVVQWPWRLTPFLVAGGGLVGSESDRGGDVDAALHWGGGLKFFATPWLNVRVDGRQVVSGAAGPGAGNTSHFEATAGLGVVLWRAPPPSPGAARAPTPVLLAEAPPVEPEPPTEASDAADEGAVEETDPGLEPVVLERTLDVQAVDPVRFGFDSAEIPGGFEPVLLEVAGLMSSRAELDVVVVGHADAIGPSAYNHALSVRRAEAVGAFLRARGIAEARMRLRGEGEDHPVASNDTPEGRARNRRTELTVVERRRRPPEVMEARRGADTDEVR